jgi:hypothetical protein
MLKRKFANWQNLIRLALSHVSMIIDEAVVRVKDGIRGHWFTIYPRRFRETLSY